MSFDGHASCGALDLRGAAEPGWQELLAAFARAAASSAIEPLEHLLPLPAKSAEAAPTSSVDLADIRHALGGDDQAYARLVRRYQPQVASQVWRASRRIDDCEELVQEVFIEAYVSLAKYRGHAPFLHWLRKITTRVCYRYWKRRDRLRRQTSLSDLQWSQISLDSSASANADRAADVVHELLSKLSPRNRMVMTLVFLEGCSIREAAELTGWSCTMVKVQSFRARRKLQALLQEGST